MECIPCSLSQKGDGRPKHPGAIFLQLTTACNAKCVNCPHPFTYGPRGHHKKGFMEEKVWNKIIRDIQAMGYRNQVGLYLHHEPLLERSLFKKIRQINEETQAFVVISTNGSLLNEKNRRCLIDSRPRIVHININSAEKNQYEAMTGLNFETTISQTKRFIAESDGKVHVEINCPVLPEVDVEKLTGMFPGTKVNTEYWANSRGGLLEGISSSGRGSRFKISDYCLQPEQNFNILFDGSVVLCCNDWAHETKNDFPTVMNQSILDIYSGTMMRRVVDEFRSGDYGRYRLCQHCAVEMGFIEKDGRPSRTAVPGRSSGPSFSAARRPLSILLATNHLFGFTGSEITLFTIAKILRERGHHVFIYAKYIDPHFTKIFNDIAEVHSDVEALSRHQADAAYVQHQTSAVELRHRFPRLPMIMASLGVLPFLEQPPFVDLSIHRYLAISEEVMNNLMRKGVSRSSITLFRNIVDSRKFSPTEPIRERPRSALIYSYKMDPDRIAKIMKACAALDIRCRHIGERPGAIHQDDLADRMNEADIVFTLGRGAIETMMCGRIPIVFDYQGGDGMVTPENIRELMTCNFSGRLHRLDYSVEELIDEIRRYDQRMGAALRRAAIELFDASQGVDALVSYLQDAMNSPLKGEAPDTREKVESLVRLINTTKEFAEAAALKHPTARPGSEISARPSARASKEKHFLRSVGQAETRLIAIYLPQFHPIPENDAWWGKGFTEWTNVAKADPLFHGHYQPHRPGELGFYDLRLPEVRKAQADLAREYGIHGFCYYHYWFNGKLLLERPLQEVLKSGEPDFPFCLCWANENWTRRWDGGDHEILIQQKYSEQDDRDHIRYLAEYFRDPRYIRVDGKPLFLVYRANRMPDPSKTTRIWREEARRLGIGELYLCRVESFPDEHTDPSASGFDAAVEFQPDWTHVGPPVHHLAEKDCRIYRYGDVAQRMTKKETPPYKRFPCVTPRWDNSPRWKRGATIFVDSTPELYERWLRSTLERFKPSSPEENIVFLNAWNEWGEGNHLEPDVRFGRGYLEATKRALDAARNSKRDPAAVTHSGILSTLVAAGKRAEAVFALEKLVESYPDYAPAYNDLGVLHGEIGNFDKALAAYEKAVSLDPGNAIFQKNLGDFYYVAIKQSDEAARHYEKALELNPGDTETLLILGNIRAETGDFPRAREIYLRVLEIDPSNDLAGSMFEALEARAEDPGQRDPDTLVREARCLARRGRSDRAVHLLEALLSVCPDHAAAHNDLGNLYCLLQKPDEALRHLERAVQLAPDSIGFVRDLADAHLAEAGNLEQALALYNKALALKPDDIETLLRIGNICAAQNQFDDARYFYNRVLTVRPDHPQAKENLAVLQGMAGADAAGADTQFCPVCGSIAHWTVTKQDHPYYACAQCRAVFTPTIDDRVLVTENQGSEGRHTPEMDGARLSHLAYKAPFEIEKVVDFGCGNGEYGRFLASRGIECLDIDQDTKLQLCGIPDESVDGINMVEVIEHLYDPIAYFKEFHRVLKPGGRLYVESSFVNGQDLQRWEYLSPAIGHCLVHSERSLALLARKFDFGLHRFNAHCYLFVKPLDARKPDGPTEHTDPQAAVADAHDRPTTYGSRAASASIIIPVFNQVEFTSRCLETLYANTPLDRVHEVIVVDNGSSDGTVAFLEETRKRYPKLKVLTNRENLLFARACNQGADIAGGDVLVFLNNDTEPRPGWFDRAMERLERDDSIGAVGVKLLYPDGTVQHCGIQFFRNVHPSYTVWPLHRHLHASADDPRVNVPGDADAVTGACLFIRTRLFRRIGGFEEGYGMYFEDTDLCFKVRRAGKRVFYEPASVVIHHEGKSSPTRDVVHALNETSARRFFKTWKEDLIRFELDTLVEKEEGRYAYLPENFWPEEVSPGAIVRIHALLSNFPPCYVHFGGAGDALLLLSTFYDGDPEQTVVSVSNSTAMMRSFFDAFPKLKKVYFVPFPKNYTWHFIARQFFKASDICRGLGATPTTTADYREWNADLDIFKTYGIQRRPDWAVHFEKNRIEPLQLVIQPRGSLKGMVGSKRNVIPPRDWPRLLAYLAKQGIRPVVIGTPDEAEEYPCLDKALDKRSHSFTEQLQLIAGSDFFVGADSWGKTFAALAGIPTFVFHAVRGDDLKGWKDASDHVFLDPWEEITVVKDLGDFRRAFDAALHAGASSTDDLKICWEGSQFVHHSLALVNRELCSRLIAGGCELSVIPYERDQFSPKEEPRFKPIAARVRKPLSGPADVHVRHQWPPSFDPPSEGHWVMIQPWEFGSLPKEWVRPMSELVDELWVPSRYVRDCFIRSGIPADRVYVVPNGVNTDLLKPGNAPYRLRTKKAFKFLFVGGTIQRKGIDILLDVYTRSFSSADDVCLVIKDMGGQSFYKGQTAKEWIRRFQDDPNRPEIEYIERTLSDREIAGLYAACDCLVHPYRGEGFGLPIAEAMASGLPVIVTGHGAALDFCNETTAYLIPAKEVRLPERRVGEFETVDFPWLAEPDREALAGLMRHAAAHPEEAAAKGRLAAEFIRSHFTWGHAAEAVKKRVRELRAKPIVRLAPRDKSAGRVREPREAAARHEHPAGGAGVSVSPALARADELYRRGNLRGATEAYLHAIKATPWDRECYLSMAEMLIQTKHYREAQDLLGEEILGAPDARMLSLLGAIQEGLGNDNEAERLAAQALALNPRFAPALNLRGVLAFGRGATEEAKTLFERAAQADPSWGEPVTNLGVLQWTAGQREAAFELLEKGFILTPVVADLAERYHAAAVSIGALARAEKVFREARRLHPACRTIAFLLIDLLISQEKHAEAMEEIEAAMAAFEVDGGFIDAALEVRRQLGPMAIGDKTPRPTLSLCMIVRNEQPNLVRCLSSVKAAVDEIVIVDTGSTDRTKDLAAVFGARVFDFAWTDDFSSARNVSLSQAKGDWILVLDADETLSPADHRKLRELIRKSPKRIGGYDLATRNYVIEANTAGWTANDGSYPGEEAGTGWYANRKVRLFRNDPRIRFSGAVHELVEASMLEAGMKIAACEIPVHHTGKLDRARVTEKGERYFELGIKKLAETGGTPRAVLELAVQAGELGRWEDAADLWRRFLGGNPGREAVRAYVNLINACLNADRFDEALSESRRAETLANGTRELLLNCAAAEFFAGDLRKAAAMAQRLLQKNPDYPPALGLLAMALALTGQEERGLECMRRLREQGLDTRAQLLPAVAKLRIAERDEQADRLQDLLDRHFPEAGGRRVSAPGHQPRENRSPLA